MIERDWVLEADLYLKIKYQELTFTAETNKSILPDYSPALEFWEAKYFMLGLESGLSYIDSEGYVQSDLLPLSPVKFDRQRMIQLFWNFKGGKRLLYHEGVCQMATSSCLSIHYGWTLSEIEMEPDKKNYGDLAYAADILVKSSNGYLVN